MHGRSGELTLLDKVRKDETKPMFERQKAHKALEAILVQMQDKKLMAMRERLVKSARAGDAYEQHKIAQSMKAYQKQDLETGLQYD